MSYKAIAVDIDGTITDMRSRVFVQAIDALREVQARGTTVILATGNVLPIAYGLAHFMGIDGPVVAENGGVVCIKPLIERINHRNAPQKAYDHLISHMDADRLFTDYWRETEVALDCKVDPDEVQRILTDHPVKVETTGFAIHIMEPDHSKYNGLLRAMDLIGIKPEEVAAFGDSDNDVQMLTGCGFGVAVGNASPAAKAAADLVTEADHADGVIEGLHHLGIL